MLFKRFRVIRTLKEPPAWLGRFHWAVTAFVALALATVILKSGYGLVPTRAGLIAVDVLNYLVLGLMLVDVVAGYVYAPSFLEHLKQRWYELALLVPIVTAIAAGGTGITFVIGRQIIVVAVAATRSRHAQTLIRLLTEQPVRLLALSFAAMIAVGTLLLTLPAATANGRGATFSDALFTATSATCVTGLIVQDTPTYFTRFGQAVILFLIQFGGLGIMTFSASLVALFGRRFGLAARRTYAGLVEEARTIDLARALRYVLLFTLLAEGAGTVMLFGRWAFDFKNPVEALYCAAFHSISAFCNAGFSLFTANLVPYRSDLVVNLTVIGLVVFGGLGFGVVHELLNRDTLRLGSRPRRRLSVHTRLVLWTTAILIVFGTIFFFFAEFDNALSNLNLGTKLLASLFQSVTPRTGGFNTVPFDALRPVTLFVWVMMMFIGASPGGTGGGIKTSTLAILLLAVRSRVSGRQEIEVGQRAIPRDTVYRAAAIAVVSSALVGVVFAVLLVTERQPFEDILFETASAFGTVGLSAGLTPFLSTAGKLILSVLMFAGRVGPLTLALATSRAKPQLPISYPEARIMVG